ncbi:MAG: HlyD family secretion protein [Zymomonas mobilis subsp. pomaceae]|uniref:Efflux transporter, RND family, MFP subunit n=1 Tax=Zymomonas mobilis subsp. pomaceae (strain ATCC 29192 / DSM 22645 / JCM 10191 / CCUG 17912 / NBRC 13757 / NCIMB 11200 / NRRL B-4491 / Barker I) TaxID=579138 RepID=F8EWB7_ZYMMT|nr:HlyD family secretion protein [Zymomonas mobilis]AEI38527.1 efflux transporter, RND family, MFP subunit [Zymomonas mobilis subsp. pomaceae ATCC 29192]MDX5948216.1 HlyD family secretion protein [Zymomonas mobilis subsp. pomaceae]GEB88972.1 hypothetical protein ZMO02_06090 [Zymomonas mobilis subsp. pomaceae]
MDRRSVLRVLVTLFVVLVAVWVSLRMWFYYEREPWTRDGRVQVDVENVTPDVSGLVTDVLVRENQYVTAGTPLFVVDRVRFRLALEAAEAEVANVASRLEQAERENRRNIRLGDLVSTEILEQGASKVDELAAELERAKANLNTARVNVVRSVVRASVDGWITNFSLRPGNYATAGRPEFALLDRRSLRIVGYFEETKLPRIRIGDKVSIRLMGEKRIIEGHVDSMARGIADRELNATSSLMANVNPTFTWVRLPQRIPVRITIDHVPEGIRLVAGRTATVSVHYNSHIRPILPPVITGGVPAILDDNTVSDSIVNTLGNNEMSSTTHITTNTSETINKTSSHTAPNTTVHNQSVHQTTSVTHQEKVKNVKAEEHAR